ncbi:hypothetical protein [Streptomyces sp. NBC_00055]|uniref:hypothetical protein n=1 Tax=Streptomyces sp. NBC_00055 TaxID=2975632 RepID=UPI00324FD93B
MGNAFSERVVRLNSRGKTYQEMASDCGFERSVTWWNKMRWVEIEDPPKPALFPSLAKALQVSERRVAEMVAEQWCGVRRDDAVPDRLRSLLAVLRGVGVDDLPVIELMAQALGDKNVAEGNVQELSEKVMALEAPEGPYTREGLERLALHELQGIVLRMGFVLEQFLGGRKDEGTLGDLDEAGLVDFILEAQEEEE